MIKIRRNVLTWIFMVIIPLSVPGQTKNVVRTKVSTAQKTTTVKNKSQVTVTASEFVDLGLPSGTLWASKNIGANKPEEYGDYFAWGETKGYKSGEHDFSWSTYKWCNGAKNRQTKYCINSSFGNNGFVDNKTELDLEDDAAYVNWGNRWKIPSYKQFKELIKYCKCRRTKYKGITGYILKGRNGNSIFLPCGGWDGVVDEYGHYRTCSLPPKQWTESETDAVSFQLSINNGIYEQGFYKYTGMCIRPVRRK